MKQFLTVLASCLLFSGNVFAADRTGIYVGTSVCENKEAKQTLELNVSPDNSMRATLSEFPAGSNSKTPIRVREFTSQQVMTYLVFMKAVGAGASSSRRAEMSLKLDPFSFSITVRLDQCSPFEMKRDVKATEKLVSRIKKEREALMKAVEKNPALIDLSKLTGFWMSHETRTDYRLIIENNQSLLQLLDSNLIIPLAPERVTSDGAVVFRARG